MLIGGDDISSDIITHGMCLQCLFTVVLISTLRLLAKSDSSVDGEPRGNWRWNSNYRDIVASSPSFLPSFPTGYGNHAAEIGMTFA